MAMATTAVTVCVASPSSSFSAEAWSWECGSQRARSRVQIASSVRSRAAAAASSPVPSSCAKAGCSSGAVSSATSRLSSSGGGSVNRPRSREWRWQAVAEQLQAETEETSEEGLPSDTLSIFFEAEGSLPEASVAKLASTLEEVEGVSDVNVTATPDGTATVKLTKQMNVQATGVASGLVDVLLKGGFKLQALNLGFDEEGGDDDDFYDYDVIASTEESEATE